MNEQSKASDWRNWVVEHGPKLLLFARQQCRSESDAQDLVQEAVLECWHRTGGSPPELPLVFATLRRRAIDLARSNDRRSHRELATNSPEPGWFEPGLEDRERSRMIQNALKQLPEMYQQVITLKIWGELTFAEIADVLNLSPNTAASRYRYGLAELRKLTKEVLA